MSFKLFVTRRLPARAMDKLEQAPEISELRVNPHDRLLTRDELAKGFGWADGVLTQLADNIDGDLLRQNPHLRIVANYAAGYNNIDVTTATDLGIPVTNTPDVLTETTADLAWSLLMAVARRLAEGDRMMRSGKFQGWAPELMLGRDIHGKTLGIVGLGRIGSAMARRARGFDMRVIYTDHKEKEQARELGAGFVDLETLLRESDFVSLHPYLDEQSRYLIDEAQLRMMRSTAILVNASRGPVVNEAALVRALREGWIAGAGLDVFENEPAMEPGLAELDNVIVIPHLGSATIDTRTAMGLEAADNILARLRGEPLLTCVNPEALDNHRIELT